MDGVLFAMGAKLAVGVGAVPVDRGGGHSKSRADFLVPPAPCHAFHGPLVGAALVIGSLPGSAVVLGEPMADR